MNDINLFNLLDHEYDFNIVEEEIIHTRTGAGIHERHYSFAMSCLAKNKRFEKMSDEKKNKAALCLDSFIREFDNVLFFEEIFELRNFTENSFKVTFPQIKDLTLNLHYELDEEMDECDQALIVYKENGEGIMRNDSIHNMAILIKELLKR